MIGEYAGEGWKRARRGASVFAVKLVGQSRAKVIIALLDD